MTCPSCGGELVPGADRCPVCETAVAPRVEGALAADPRLVTPPARPRRDPRERSWRDEVQERIRSRRQKRVDAGLPLFDEPPTAPGPIANVPAPRPVRVPPAVPAAAATEAADTAASETSLARGDSETDVRDAAEPELFSPQLSEAELADLPLRPRGPAVAHASSSARLQRVTTPVDAEAILSGAEAEPDIELTSAAVEPSPLERPARAGERAQAAAVDLAVFVLLGGVVLYFAARSARVEMGLLASSWPWLAVFLGLLAAFYASYFTGTTGQTPGKLLTGLRVLDTGGRPPGYPRAVARAVLGVLGVALAGAGLVPMIFDPAGRALHDRLFRTRVVRR